MIITMRHIRKAKMCSKGGRAFAKKHNVDWEDFLKNGVDSKDFEDMDDAMVQKVLEIARVGK